MIMKHLRQRREAAGTGLGLVLPLPVGEGRGEGPMALGLAGKLGDFMNLETLTPTLVSSMTVVEAWTEDSLSGLSLKAYPEQSRG